MRTQTQMRFDGDEQGDRNVMDAVRVALTSYNIVDPDEDREERRRDQGAMRALADGDWLSPAQAERVLEALRRMALTAGEQAETFSAMEVPAVGDASSWARVVAEARQQQFIDATQAFLLLADALDEAGFGFGCVARREMATEARRRFA